MLLKNFSSFRCVLINVIYILIYTYTILILIVLNMNEAFNHLILDMRIECDYRGDY